MADLTETEQKNIEIVQRWFQEVWNEGRAETIEELMDPEAAAYGLPQDPSLKGPAGFKQTHTVFRGAFPDMNITLGPIVAKEDMVAVHFVCNATHLGDHLGVPPTGDPVVIHGQTITRMRNGRLIEGWNTIDLLGVIQAAVTKAAVATGYRP